jgi:hypothetical protein
MEKVFLFIIIMIISSLISKRKKRQAEQSFGTLKRSPDKDKERNMGANYSKEPSSQLKELLSKFGSDRVAEPHKSVENKQEFVFETSPVMYADQKYEDSHPQENDQDQHEINFASARRNGEVKKDISYNDRSSYENMKIRETKAKKPDHDWNMPEVIRKPRVTLAEVFGSRQKLKNSIIAAEVLNRKYT